MMLANGVLKGRSDLMIMIHAILPLVFAIKVIGQIIGYFMGKDRKSTQTIKDVVDFLIENEKNLTYFMLLEPRLKLICRLVKSFIVLMAIVYTIPIINSIIATLIKGEATYALYIILPLIDENSMLGYCLNTFIQCLLIFIVFMLHIGITTGQCYFILLVRNFLFIVENLNNFLRTRLFRKLTFC